MDYKTMRNQIEDMVSDNHKDFVKAVISMEKGINDENALDKLYEAYMDNDTVNLLHEEFDYMIEDLREQVQSWKETPSVIFVWSFKTNTKTERENRYVWKTG